MTRDTIGETHRRDNKAKVGYKRWGHARGKNRKEGTKTREQTRQRVKESEIVRDRQR